MPSPNAAPLTRVALAVHDLGHRHGTSRPARLLYRALDFALLRTGMGLEFPDTVEVGDDLTFAHGGRGTVVNAEATIGNRVTICHGVTIAYGVTIHDDVYIAPGAVVLEFVTLHAGCIVGANSVVTRDVPENHVAVGVPAVARPHRPAQEGELRWIAPSEYRRYARRETGATGDDRVE